MRLESLGLGLWLTHLKNTWEGFLIHLRATFSFISRIVFGIFSSFSPSCMNVLESILIFLLCEITNVLVVSFVWSRFKCNFIRPIWWGINKCQNSTRVENREDVYRWRITFVGPPFSSIVHLFQVIELRGILVLVFLEVIKNGK